MPFPSFVPSLAADLVAVGITAAEQRATPMAVALVDARSALVAFARTRDATPAAIDAAPAKARTAMWFGRPTADTLEIAARRPEVYQSLIGVSPQPLVLSMGGIPLHHDGEIVGAVAAAGAKLGATDIEVAEVMVEAWTQATADAR